MVNEADDDEVVGLFTADTPVNKGSEPSQVSVLLDQTICKMQLDTGATGCILPKSLYCQQFNQSP